LEDPSVDGRIILTGVFKEQAARIGNVKLRASVNTVMNFGVAFKVGKISAS